MRAAIAVVLVATGACVRVEPHHALPSLALGEPAFQATAEAFTGAPVTGGNAVTLLFNGDQIFPAQLAAIRSARRSITYAQYFFADGRPPRDIADAIAERCRAGVRGHVLLDAFGTLGMPAEHRATMEKAGCEVATFRPLRPFALDKANHRNHRRILVVDGRIGFTGGSGASSKWTGNGRMDGQWRDTDVRVEGPATGYLQGAFVENWQEATGTLLGGADYFPPPSGGRGDVLAQVVRSSGAAGSFSVYTMLLLAMSAARRSIYITNPYFLPDARMRAALLDAARRGVRVVLLLPGEIDHALVRKASRSEFGPLLAAGVEIHEYRAGLLHAKTMTVDGLWGTIGSANLDNRSFALNEELNLVVYSRDVVRRLEESFRDDLAHARRVDYSRWLARGPLERLLELLAAPVRDQL
jgi:cardiolipin synthase